MPNEAPSRDSLELDLSVLEPLDPDVELPAQDFSYPVPKVMTMISETFTIDLSDPGNVLAVSSRVSRQSKEQLKD